MADQLWLMTCIREEQLVCGGGGQLDQALHDIMTAVTRQRRHSTKTWQTGVWTI